MKAYVGYATVLKISILCWQLSIARQDTSSDLCSQSSACLIRIAEMHSKDV